MINKRLQKSGTTNPGAKPTYDYHELSHQVLEYSNRSIAKIDFLHEILKMILNFSNCDSLDLWLKENGKFNHYEIHQSDNFSFQFEIIKQVENQMGEYDPFHSDQSLINLLRFKVLNQKYELLKPFISAGGSFWVGDTKTPLASVLNTKEKKHYRKHIINGHFRSIALIPISSRNDQTGLLQLTSRQPDFFTESDIDLYEYIAEIVGIALVNQQAQAALRERVKELTCLYSIAQISERQGMSLGEILQGIVELLPPAWQYPDVTAARVILDNRFYTTAGFQEEGQKQISGITVNRKHRGVVQVVYVEEKPNLNGSPFLREERNLIDAIARQIALIIERKEAEEERSKLQDQLRHADRLATIGQLAAGVAHELNEPLGNILGFAQLAKKCPDLPGQANNDINEIVDASLHSREIIKKLMIFARQMPPQKAQIDLNKVIEEGLYFFDARCARAGISLIRSPSPDIPKVIGDMAQLNQVLVNLVVNSIQAMPNGGELTIKTYCKDNDVFLAVKDTGIGMSKDVLDKIFIPFFTTKDVDEGTGLGLAVVHGIVTSHKGSISVTSMAGKGSRFEIKFPGIES